MSNATTEDKSWTPMNIHGPRQWVAVRKGGTPVFDRCRRPRDARHDEFVAAGPGWAGYTLDEENGDGDGDAFAAGFERADDLMEDSQFSTSRAFQRFNRPVTVSIEALADAGIEPEALGAVGLGEASTSPERDEELERVRELRAVGVRPEFLGRAIAPSCGPIDEWEGEFTRPHLLKERRNGNSGGIFRDKVAADAVAEARGRGVLPRFGIAAIQRQTLAAARIVADVLNGRIKPAAPKAMPSETKKVGNGLKVGMEFAGTVVSHTGYGIFIRGSKGDRVLVHVNSLKELKAEDGSWRFKDRAAGLAHLHSHKLGDRVRVRIAEITDKGASAELLFGGQAKRPRRRRNVRPQA